MQFCLATLMRWGKVVEMVVNHQILDQASRSNPFQVRLIQLTTQCLAPNPASIRQTFQCQAMEQTSILKTKRSGWMRWLEEIRRGQTPMESVEHDVTDQFMGTTGDYDEKSLQMFPGDGARGGSTTSGTGTHTGGRL